LQKYLIRTPFVGLCTFPQLTTSYHLPFLRHAALAVDAVRGAFLGPRSPRATKFCTVPPNICGSSVTFLTPRRWLVDFEKIVYLSINYRVQETCRVCLTSVLQLVRCLCCRLGDPGFLFEQGS
jgi:hypothetical protein